MNIYAKNGDKVKITEKSFNNGHEFDRIKIAKLLRLGQVYEVDGTEVHSFSSEVYLKEFPGEQFNTVNFEDVEVNDPQPHPGRPGASEWNLRREKVNYEN